jgi:hypothetical protein
MKHLWDETNDQIQEQADKLSPKQQALIAYRQARRQLVEVAVGRLQAATGQAVSTLLQVTKEGAKDGDRVRAAVALLDYAFRGFSGADTLQGEHEAGKASPMDTAEVVQLLGALQAGLLGRKDKEKG